MGSILRTSPVALVTACLALLCVVYNLYAVWLSGNFPSRSMEHLLFSCLFCVGLSLFCILSLLFSKGETTGFARGLRLLALVMVWLVFLSRDSLGLRSAGRKAVIDSADFEAIKLDCRAMGRELLSEKKFSTHLNVPPSRIPESVRKLNPMNVVLFEDRVAIIRMSRNWEDRVVLYLDDPGPSTRGTELTKGVYSLLSN